MVTPGDGSERGAGEKKKGLHRKTFTWQSVAGIMAVQQNYTHYTVQGRTDINPEFSNLCLELSYLQLTLGTCQKTTAPPQHGLFALFAVPLHKSLPEPVRNRAAN